MKISIKLAGFIACVVAASPTTPLRAQPLSASPKVVFTSNLKLGEN
ncbi:MAG: hypothetical protein RL077_6073, partial [Verrucomicrobiota bacterium]